jgi:hypothetical protein
MSSFAASNSRIRVVETVSSVDQTVFDTNDDMPHIVGTATISNVTVDFSAMAQSQYGTGTIIYQCVYLAGYGWLSCAEVDVQIDPRESSTVTNIANLPVDEDGNVVGIDFVVVQATGVRTLAGKDPRFNQALPTTVPPKTFSFQGSVLLESSGTANGASWLRRIVSVYPSGTKLKMKVQESIGFLARGIPHKSVASNPPFFPHAADSRSTYSFTFKVFYGKFRQ